MKKVWTVLFLLACDDETDKPRQVGVPIPRDVGVDARGVDAGRADANGDADAHADADATASVDADIDATANADAHAHGDVEVDRGVVDMALPPVDMALPPVDMALPPVDMALPPVDMALPPVDMALPPVDMALPVDQGLPPGVRPCSLGEGTTLFAVHWDGGERPDVDHWAANCEYGFDINGCGAFPRCRDAIGNCNVAVVDGGLGLLLDGNDDLLFRFHVNGLAFQGATLYFQARGTRGQGNLEVWSPIYGGLQGPVAGDQVYAWYEVDWSEFLSPFDDPGLTAIRFRAVGGNVAIHAVEVCLR